MMRRKGALWVCLTTGMLCLAAPRTLGATADPETDSAPTVRAPVPAGHSVKPAKPAARARRTADESADDPESRPLTRYQKPGAPVAGEEDSGSLAMNVAGKLALVVALILACAAAWKRYQGGMPAVGQSPAQPVKVTSTVPLGPQRFLHVVTVGQHQLLLASSPQNVSLIATLDANSALIDTPGMAASARSASGAMEESLAGYEEEAEASASPEDRFEELLLRLQELEPGPAAGPRASGQNAHRGQTAGRSSRAPERDDSGGAGSAGPRPGVRSTELGRTERRPLDDEGDEAGRLAGSTGRAMPGALAPGSLFRSAVRVPREGGDA